MYNSFHGLGHLSKDIILTYSPKGTAIANTSIATNHVWTDDNGEKKEETCFMDVTAFGKTAEIMNQFLKSGSKLMVEGRVQFQQWEDATTKKPRSKHVLIVNTMKMLDNKAQDSPPQQQA